MQFEVQIVVIWTLALQLSCARTTFNIFYEHQGNSHTYYVGGGSGRTEYSVAAEVTTAICLSATVRGERLLTSRLHLIPCPSCPMLFSTVTSWLASFLAASLSDHERAYELQTRPTPLRFELRHLHAVSPDARVVFHDVPKSDIELLAQSGEPSSYSLRPRRARAHRPHSIDAFHRARVRSMRFQETEVIDWDEIEVDGPDVEDRETLLLLAKMTNNAYLAPGEEGWYELGDHWNVVSSLSTTFATLPLLLEQQQHLFYTIVAC